MRGLLGGINNLPIRKKFILLYVLCVIVPLVVTQGFVLSVATSEIRARERQNAEMSLNRARTTIEYQFSTALALVNAIAADTQVEARVRRQYAEPTAYFQAYYDWLRPKLSGYLSSYAQQVTSIELYADNDTLLSGGLVMRLSDQVRSADWYRAAETSAAGHMIGYARQMPGGIQPQISIVRTLEGAKNDAERLVKVNLSMTPIHRSLYQEREYMQLYLVDPAGTVFSNSNSYLGGSAAGLSALPEKFDIEVPVGEGAPLSDWRLLAVVSRAALNESIWSTVLTSVLVAILVSVFAALAATVIAESISKRSQTLLTHMDAVAGGRFSPIGEDNGSDEISELISHYNDMSERLRRLVDDVYRLGAQKKSLELERVRAEMKYLQAQVDPHFLFNTFNALLVVSVKNHYDQIVPVIRSLAKILRRMADTSDDLVPLSVELDFTKMYLDIMRFRYGEKFSYEIVAGPEIEQVPLPQMSIQSLAENACKHGIGQIASGSGHIRIEARLVDGDAIWISVRDNGVGIEPEALERILKGLRENREPIGNVGLSNVYRRLALYYAGDADLTLESRPGETVAVMRIPLHPSGGERYVQSIAGG